MLDVERAALAAQNTYKVWNNTCGQRLMPVGQREALLRAAHDDAVGMGALRVVDYAAQEITFLGPEGENLTGRVEGVLADYGHGQWAALLWWEAGWVGTYLHPHGDCPPWLAAHVAAL